MVQTPSSTGRNSPALSSSIMSATIRSRSSRGYRFSTLCTTVDNPDADHGDQHGSSSVPIYQTATFKGMGGSYDYTRSGNPSRTFLEHHISKISSAKHAIAVTSGMGALDIIFRLLRPGDEIIAGNDLYGGSNRLLNYLHEHSHIETHHVDTTKADSLIPYLGAGSRVRMILLESPTNPLLQIADLEAIATMVHQAVPEALVVVDNTMMSPYLMRPLEFGADIVYDSGTKYLSGHHDLMAGLVICNHDHLAKRLRFVVNSIGNGLAPFDCFLLLRGVKTLAIRFDRQQASAIAVARYLHRLGFKVNYPGLPQHPGREIHERLARGPGAVLSFETGDVELSERIVGAARLWGISVSFGCVNSLISMPCLMSHASIDPAVRKARNLPEDLIRLCVGIEDTDDLIEDLEASLIEAGAVRIIDEVSSDGVQLERVVQEPQTPVSLNGFVDVDDHGTKAKVRAAAAVSTSMPERLLVSAPGKVILFGEHAVVHGVTAIAGSVSLRCFCLVEPRHDGRVAICLPDVSFDASWKLDELPWAVVKMATSKITNLPEEDVVTQLETLVSAEKPNARHAAKAFLYLYLKIQREDYARSATFTFRSLLPIGAGLGSSAAFSVCSASALLYYTGRLPVPSIQSSLPRGAGYNVIPDHDATLINSWAFVAEKILHGNPSGVDNTIATLGGVVAFKKATTAKPAIMDSLQGFKSIRFLITDSKIPRDTKSLVAGVATRKLNDPDYINSILNSIQSLTDSAQSILTDASVNRLQHIKGLERLIDENHRLLVSLGVGHERLEVIRDKTGAKPYNLHTKLTGAGGGGCTVTIIPDDLSEELLDNIKNELEETGFKCYETVVGGSGLGILGSSLGSTKEWDLLRQDAFRKVPNEELIKLTDDLDGWAFV